jgi:hypothetical protein
MQTFRARYALDFRGSRTQNTEDYGYLLVSKDFEAKPSTEKSSHLYLPRRAIPYLELIL